MKQICEKDVQVEAIELLKDPRFLYNMGRFIHDSGVTGERRNSLTLFLAGLTAALDEPVSVIVKGSTSSGKSNLLRGAASVLPPERLVFRTSLSQKAPAHTRESYAGKILYLAEYKGGRESQYLTRVQMSDGQLVHEYANSLGAEKTTHVAHRIGRLAVWTSTTQRKVFADDESRFLTVWSDESAEATLAVLEAAITQRPELAARERAIIQHASRLLMKKPPDFSFPAWMKTIARRLPLRQVRERRDFLRFLALIKAVALCRRFSDLQAFSCNPVEINFSDYCVSRAVLNPAFSSTVHGVHEREIAVVDAVNALNRKYKAGVTTAQISDRLGWSLALTYKFTKRCIEDKLLTYEPETRPRNEKWLLPVRGAAPAFLPSPASVFQEHRELGRSVSFLDPIDGAVRTVARDHE